MKRTLQDFAISFGIAGVVAVVMSLLEGVVASDLLHLPKWIHDNDGSLTILCGVLLTFLIICLVTVENRLKKVLRSFRQSLWLHVLRFLLDLVISMATVAFGILLNNFIPDIEPLEQWITTHEPLSTYLSIAVLLVLAASVPLVKLLYWISNGSGLRTEPEILIALHERYKSHLDSDLTDIDHRFALNMVPKTEAVLPWGQTGLSPVIDNPAAESKGADGNETNASDATEQALRSIYEKAQRRLLILADPGGGKSTQLYLLAKKPVDEAVDELKSNPHAQPHIPFIPVVLDLATFPDNSQDLEDWLIEAIVRIYNVQRKAASNWVKSGRIAPLLDSLDVLTPDSKRIRIVEKINKYLMSFPQRPLIVACGTDRYKALGEWVLKLQYAVMLEPLTDDAGGKDGQVREILKNAAQIDRLRGNEPKAQQVEVLLKDLDDPDVMKTLRIPLMLNVALTNLKESAVTYVKGSGIAGLKRSLFNRYVERTMQLPNQGPMRSAPPTAEDIRKMEKGLAWVGHVLRVLSLDIFYLRYLQRKLLPSPEAEKNFYRWLKVINFVIRALIVPLLGLAVGILMARIAGGAGTIFEKKPAPFPEWIETYLFPAVGGLGGLGVGLGIIPIGSKKGDENDKKGEDESMRGRPDSASSNLIRSLFFATGVVAIASLAIGAIGVLYGGTSLGLVSGLTAALVFGLLTGTLSRLGRDPNDPNAELIYRVVDFLRIIGLSTLFGLLVGGVVVGAISQGVIFTGPFASAVSDSGAHALALVVVGGAGIGLGVGFVVGLSIAFSRGGAAWIEHFIIRHEIKKSGVIPYGIKTFLDLAVDYHLLRQEGSGYSFIVRSTLLRDYFADSYQPPKPKKTPKAK